MWDLLRPGLKPVSPALAGGFLTTVPPGKSLHRVLVAAGGLFSCGMRTLSCGMHVGSSSLTRDQTPAPCIGNTVLSIVPPGKSPNYTYLKCTVWWVLTWIYLWNHHHNQDSEHVNHSPKFSCAPLIPPSPSKSASSKSAYRLVCIFKDFTYIFIFYINEIILSIYPPSLPFFLRLSGFFHSA